MNRVSPLRALLALAATLLAACPLGAGCTDASDSATATLGPPSFTLLLPCGDSAQFAPDATCAEPQLIGAAPHLFVYTNPLNITLRSPGACPSTQCGHWVITLLDQGDSALSVLQGDAEVLDIPLDGISPLFGQTFSLRVELHDDTGALEVDENSVPLIQRIGPFLLADPSGGGCACPASLDAGTDGAAGGAGAGGDAGG